MFATLIRAVISEPDMKTLPDASPASLDYPLWLPFLVLGLVAGVCAVVSMWLPRRKDR